MTFYIENLNYSIIDSADRGVKGEARTAGERENDPKRKIWVKKMRAKIAGSKTRVYYSRRDANDLVSAETVFAVSIFR